MYFRPLKVIQHIKLSLRLANAGSRGHWPLELYVVRFKLTANKNLLTGYTLRSLLVDYSDPEIIEMSFKLQSYFNNITKWRMPRKRCNVIVSYGRRVKIAKLRKVKGQHRKNG